MNRRFDEDFVHILSILQATKVERQAPGIDAGVGAQMEIEGFVTDLLPLEPDEFVVNGQQVRFTSQTLFENGTAADLAMNVKLEAEGAIDDGGILVAKKISFRQAGGGVVKIEAEAEAVDSADGTVTLMGHAIRVHDLTQFKDSRDDMRDFALRHIGVGDWLEVRGFINGTGAISASSLQRDEADNEVLWQGIVDRVEAPNLTIMNLLVRTNAETQFADIADSELTESTFFTRLRAGDVVKSKGILNSDGSVLATEIEFELN